MGGDVLTFIKFNVRHTITPILFDIETIKITLHLASQNLYIINLYNPPQKIIKVHKHNQLSIISIFLFMFISYCIYVYMLIIIIHKLCILLCFYIA